MGIIRGIPNHLTHNASLQIREFNRSDDNQNQVLLEELCRLYTQGAEVDWDELYRNVKCQKMSLPVYPFEKNRCWMDFSKKVEETYQDNTYGLYHNIQWQLGNLKPANNSDTDGLVLILKDA